ncbi:sigma-70 family RNA polymerase sigma factor [Kineococcus rubinsiae]|uniref:sigma-70 family RNA polymerase sigma factor n=1 Tax=Kineococcus rubinsiae TaxID=2609562 RepID=UPI00143151D6|nr:sigma-70 family RNA polymerase sigma factor [Kineococcus rubinsiae]NIZ93474.1 sigma-70 family RNA polymerase sigma factor [Kineococcus rubinsiae]
MSADTSTDTAVDAAQLEPRLAEHRGQLTGYCYRMLGSAFDAEDAVQETMLRAWKGLDGFEQRSALRSWLFRIATNVCLTMIESRSRRARPMDLSATAWEPVEASLGARRPEDTWLEPMVDSRVLPSAGDPAEVAVARESVRLAFVAALQHLPPRQRAVLLLRDVLRWKADEVAALLESTTASVNSALQRARATLADLPGTGSGAELSAADKQLLERYVAAFEAYDMAALATLLADDVTQNMPPFEMWLEGADDLRTWMLGPGHGCRGSRLVPVGVNGQPGFAHYRPSGPGGAHEPFALVVLEVRDGAVQAITSFLDTRLFALFGIPATPQA